MNHTKKAYNIMFTMTTKTDLRDNLIDDELEDDFKAYAKDDCNDDFLNTFYDIEDEASCKLY